MSDKPVVQLDNEPKRTWLTYLPWLLLVVALGGVFVWGLRREDPNKLESALVGKPAPAFSLPVLQPYQARYGQEFGVKGGEGKPIILNIWASWCIPCRTEAPLLEQYAQRYGDKVLFLGINVQDQQPAALGFIEEFSLRSFPSVFDGRGRIGIDYGYYGVPETFVIDASGKVLLRHAGAVSEADLQGFLKQVGL